jgi:hypothetical protein
MFNRNTQECASRVCDLADRDMKVSYETFLKALFRQNNSLNLNVYHTASLSVTHGRYIIYEVSVY